MPLRLVDIIVPGNECDHISEIIDEMPAIESSVVDLRDGRANLRVLLEAKYVEHLSDALARNFGSRDEYRIVTLSAEATAPAIPEAIPSRVTDEVDAPAKQSGRISREELYSDIAEGAAISWVYIVMVFLSTVVAAVGLLRGDVAIVIGAMVIAPLLGPNVALSLAVTLGDLKLVGQSLGTIAIGVAVALLVSFLMGAVLEIDPNEPQLLARAGIGLADLALALAAGAAGTLAFTTGVSSVVVGVMVAVALLPPLVVTGLYLGAGYPELGLQSLLLVLANVACINLSAVATFVLQKVRPRTWLESEKARRATRVAVIVWVVTLAVLVGLIAISDLSI